MLPVIESGAFDLAFVERESERLDEVQSGPGCKAGAAGVTGIPVDLGVDEDDVNGQSGNR